MARTIGCVCYYAVCVVVLVFVIPSSDSAKNRALDVEYHAAGISHSFATEVRSLEEASLLRVRRQASGNITTQVSVTTAPPLTTTQRPSTTTTRATPRPATAPILTPVPTTQAPTTTTPRTRVPSTAASPDTPVPSGSGNDNSETTTASLDIVQNNHNYYASSINPDQGSADFVELDSPTSQGTLNSGHRVAVTILLPFKFPFYGHTIQNVTIATGGFIYMSPFLHQWLTATQYIAPLMANFDTSVSSDSNIFYNLVGDEFIIEWHNVLLKDQSESGPFVFQAKLRKDGTIKFVYKTLPVPVSSISSSEHPVKIGISDAFYNDTFLPEFGIKRRTIIEYHRVSFLEEQIEEGTVITLTPLPTCNTITSCKKCTKHEGVKFNCKWCDEVSRCSDGLDWYRQDWEVKGCKSEAFDDQTKCYASTSTTSTAAQSATSTQSPPPTTQSPKSTSPLVSSSTSLALPAVSNLTAGCRSSSGGKCKGDGPPVAAIVAVVLVLVVLFGAVAVWLTYAYTHPTSPSGMWLMEHRPSQMKAKLASMKFWKKNTPAGTKYAVESEA